MRSLKTLAVEALELAPTNVIAIRCTDAILLAIRPRQEVKARQRERLAAAFEVFAHKIQVEHSISETLITLRCSWINSPVSELEKDVQQLEARG